MFQHLLVPLDGSRLAEAALPPAACLAGALGARITLIHVIERNAPQAVHGERHLTDAAEAAAYLAEVAARTLAAGVQVERHVHSDEVGDVARSLSEHSCELRPDLIVMCAHGRGGLRKLVFGGIAQPVIALGTTPVLLIQPGRRPPERPFACRILLVPLDGDPPHEAGLSVAAGLARACRGALHLLTVVHTRGTLSGARAATGRLLPGATAAALDMAQEAAKDYLRRLITHLQADGLAANAEVARGDPARGIVRIARRAGADLIVLATHGKAGTDAFWTGSVAAAVARRTRLPPPAAGR